MAHTCRRLASLRIFEPKLSDSVRQDTRAIKPGANKDAGKQTAVCLLLFLTLCVVKNEHREKEARSRRRRAVSSATAIPLKFGDFESQFQELALDSGSTPTRILGRQGSDEIAKLRGDFRSAATTARKEEPVPAETRAMPAHDGLGLHDRQHARPSRPATPEAQPEETIAKAQPGSRILKLEDADLLPEGHEFQSEVMSRAEEDTEPREKSQKKPDHGRSLHDAVATGRRCCKLLIARIDGILRTDRWFWIGRRVG
jgi:hypothetical protein